MNEKTYVLDFEEDKESYDIKEAIAKYVRFWPWFLGMVLLFCAIAFAYMKYAPVIYKTEAKIKILEDAMKTSVVKDVISIASANPNNRLLDIQNQIKVIQSYRLLHNVVDELHLDIEYQQLNNLLYKQIWEPPFTVRKNISEDKINEPLKFEVKLTETGFDIVDEEGTQYNVPYNEANTSVYYLPFKIELAESITNVKNYRNDSFKVIIDSKRKTTLKLAKKLTITTEANSEVLNLSLLGESKQRSEQVLNSIINNFNQDGILDRQLVSRRTLEVIEKRFVYLSQELDSIEAGKQNLKQEQNISFIQSDAGANLQRKTEAESEALKLETQVSLSNLLKKTVANEAEYNLLPADIGLANSGLNAMVSNYNNMARERQKLITSVGSNHPTLVKLSKQLELSKLNILSSVNNYEAQLALSLRKTNQEKNSAGYRFSRLPETERMLRSIERQQSIKENLYLLLLQKREEATIDYASTAPTIKVIEYGLTNLDPLWPKPTVVFPVSILLGLLLPFLVFYIRFSTDNNIHDRSEIEQLNPEIPVVAEIPFFEKDKKFIDVNDRSVLAESFRILGANVTHLLSPEETDETGKVIFVTSAVKGEGKTLLALNLSLAYASIGKRVLLVGGDLRNPTLHTYLGLDKNSQGLADYLAGKIKDFEPHTFEGFKANPDHKIFLSGAVPSNVPVLLSGKNFEQFLEEAKKEYDYVIMDTAPTMLVTDTLLIAKHADITLFAVRAGVTDKNVMKFSKELNKSKKVKNMVYVMNAVGQVHAGKLNYGYGYGYEMEQSEKSKKWFKKA
ncbi:polysaccharide biosynthesis tyrosine autokinase [Maribacter confluentis]|uniref:non-specific protein-tyrosine kinase n=1 Tax=Maribacter confluentis TaxID=1656093 RepID=A0ABT8RS48_9FLAO|nr:tyrosine-protein kinase family protein [Maribacter confluentis]MDO1513675.1 polysaccharide biosynthesis tyrosine autokinase [Maribacter confluentis]MDO1514798.1 polysaccharide biosynthesis tyrosine autokinase [Maribacter confluentis]